MELRTSSNPQPHINDEDTTSSSHTATLQNPVPVLIRAENHLRLERPAPGSHWGQDHWHICVITVKGIQTAVIQNNINNNKIAADPL